MHEELRNDECAQLEMIPSLFQNFLAANIAGAAKHQVGEAGTVYMYAMLPGLPALSSHLGSPSTYQVRKPPTVVQLDSLHSRRRREMVYHGGEVPD